MTPACHGRARAWSAGLYDVEKDGARGIVAWKRPCAGHVSAGNGAVHPRKNSCRHKGRCSVMAAPLQRLSAAAGAAPCCRKKAGAFRRLHAAQKTGTRRRGRQQYGRLHPGGVCRGQPCRGQARCCCRRRERERGQAVTCRACMTREGGGPLPHRCSVVAASEKGGRRCRSGVQAVPAERRRQPATTAARGLAGRFGKREGEKGRSCKGTRLLPRGDTPASASAGRQGGFNRRTGDPWPPLP